MSASQQACTNSHSSCSSTIYFEMAFWLGSQVRLDMQVPGDCKTFVRKSVNNIYRKKTL